jgi:hypothetical protein
MALMLNPCGWSLAVKAMVLMLNPWVEFGCKGNGADVESMGGGQLFNFLIFAQKTICIHRHPIGH